MIFHVPGREEAFEHLPVSFEELLDTPSFFVCVCLGRCLSMSYPEIGNNIW